MKKILAVALMFAFMIVAGCSSDNSSEVPSVLLKNSFWVTDSGNMPYLIDAIARDDVEYLKQLMLEGKVFQVDRDTKVTRFGVAANENYALISFKEGRYTNKSGCALKVSVYTEEEYQIYLEEKRKEAEQREQERQAKIEKEKQDKEVQKKADEEAKKQEAVALVQNSLARTENYYLLITEGNEGELRRMAEMCSEDEEKLMATEPRFYDNLDVREYVKKAHEIVRNRGVSVLVYLKFKITDGIVEEYHQKTEQARQEFRDKYGY